MCGLPPPSSDFGPEMTRSGFAFPLALRSTRVDSTPRSLSNGRRFWHEDGEPAADYANYADADVRPNGQLASLHPRNSRNPRLVPIALRLMSSISSRILSAADPRMMQMALK